MLRFLEKSCWFPRELFCGRQGEDANQLVAACGQAESVDTIVARRDYFDFMSLIKHAGKGSGLSMKRAFEFILRSRIVTPVLIFGAAALGQSVTQPASQPDLFRSPLQVIQTVPMNLYPKTANEWNAAKISAINDILKEKAVGRPAEFEIVVDRIETVQRNKFAIVGVTQHVGQIPIFLWPRTPDAKVAAAINKGDHLKANGLLYAAHFDRRPDKSVALSLDLQDCTFSPAEAKAKK